MVAADIDIEPVLLREKHVQYNVLAGLREVNIAMLYALHQEWRFNEPHIVKKKHKFLKKLFPGSQSYPLR